MDRIKRWLNENVLYLAWLQAIIGTAASLFYSEILKFAPCVLCWYQRICLYPLVAIILVGIVKKDKHVAWYVLPLSIAGFIIALYHNLLYFNIIPETLAPCTTGVSCTTKFVEYFGFITIPFLSMLAFLFITVCMIYYHVTHKHTHNE
jgi:disulfide bond formation protein DsbB